MILVDSTTNRIIRLDGQLDMPLDKFDALSKSNQAVVIWYGVNCSHFLALLRAEAEGISLYNFALLDNAYNGAVHTLGSDVLRDRNSIHDKIQVILEFEEQFENLSNVRYLAVPADRRSAMEQIHGKCLKLLKKFYELHLKN
jgi:hypothetical protein